MVRRHARAAELHIRGIKRQAICDIWIAKKIIRAQSVV